MRFVLCIVIAALLPGSALAAKGGTISFSRTQAAVLVVKTDRVYDTVSAGHRISDGSLVVDIGFDGLKLRIIESK
jgi:hypothetical protein